MEAVQGFIVLITLCLGHIVYDINIYEYSEVSSVKHSLDKLVFLINCHFIKLSL